jgi:hypothetical protein
MISASQDFRPLFRTALLAVQETIMNPEFDSVTDKPERFAVIEDREDARRDLVLLVFR